MDDTNSILAYTAGLEQATLAAPPSFMVMVDGHLDGWRPTPETGNEATDRIIGEIYADEAVKYARGIRDPKFLTFVIASINTKAARGEIRFGPREQGFFDRVANLAFLGSLN